MFIDNVDIKLHRILKEQIEKSDEVIIASAFIADTDIIYNLLESDKLFTLIFRLSHPATPDFLTKLLNLSKQNSKLYYYDRSTYHPKIYLFKKAGKSFSAIIGSSNFTNGGLRNNYEYNILTIENLKDIEAYIKRIIAESDDIMSQATIDYYKTFYEAPKTNPRYNKSAISLKRIMTYQEIMEHWSIVKGLLESYNTTELPFTYVYDAFCHHFKVRMRKELQVNEPIYFDKGILTKYFDKFVTGYFSSEDQLWRKERLEMNTIIRNNITSVSTVQLRSFFLNLHSITSGSGSGIRRSYFKNQATRREMKVLLTFLIKEKRSMEEKYAISLLKTTEGGVGIRYIGDSGVGEIIGWIFPKDYPIINGKFHDSLEFFKV